MLMPIYWVRKIQGIIINTFHITDKIIYLITEEQQAEFIKKTIGLSYTLSD